MYSSRLARHACLAKHVSIGGMPSLASSSSSSPLVSARQSRRRLDAFASCRGRRMLSASSARQLPSDDPGGKPNDGSHPTVYDDFKNIITSNEPHLSIHSMGTSTFTLSDGLVAHTPIILLNKQVFLWDAPDLSSSEAGKPIMPNGVGWEAWNDDLWKVFEVVSPRPEIIVFGTGKTVLPPPPQIRAYLNKLGIQIEAHDTRNACSTFNLLIEEERLVAAALIPTERKGTQRVRAVPDTATANA